jgi:hypothetical protein
MYRIKANQNIPKDNVLSPTSVTDIPAGVNFDLGKTQEEIEHPAGDKYAPTVSITMLAALNKQRLSKLHNPSHHALYFFSSNDHTTQASAPEQELDVHGPR